MAHDVLLHLTWKTWAAAPSIDAEIAGHLKEALPRFAVVERAAIVEGVILPSHVHLIAELERLADVSRLVQRLKGASSRFANRDGWSSRGRLLRWEPGYDARSVARQNLPSLIAYFDHQAQHHGTPVLARWSAIPKAA